MAYAKLWPNVIIILHVQATHILTHLSECHIYASVNQVNTGSDNDKSPIRRHVII